MRSVIVDVTSGQEVKIEATDGCIPFRVEKWLMGNVFIIRYWTRIGRWALETDHTMWEFDWPHDYPPTLQQAIEAVMAESQ